MNAERTIELTKLARVLDVPQAELAYVSALDGPALRAAREAISATLFDDARPLLQRVARASKLLPSAMAAKVGERVFGPILCAHVASLLAPEHALELAVRMPNEFLAEVASRLDPRRAHGVVSQIPVEQVVAVAQILFAARDHVTLGRFVDAISRDKIAAVIAAIPDELALLEIVMFVEVPTKLAALVDLVPPARLRALVLAADRAQMWPYLLPIAAQMTGAARALCAKIVEDQPPDILARIVAAARDPGSWPGLLAIASEMRADAQLRLAEQIAAQVESLRDALADAMRTPAVWQAVLPLAVRLPPAQRQHLVRVMLERGVPLLSLVSAAPDDAELWRPVIERFIALDEPTRLAIASSSAHPARDAVIVLERASALGLAFELPKLGS